MLSAARTAGPRCVVGVAIVMLAVAGGAALGRGLYLEGKAFVGQQLLHWAWMRSTTSGAATRPWPWADTHPVARLIAPAQHVDLLVLAGANGRTLAWGPGYLDGSSALAGDGNVVLSAHRDTHFRFLRDVRAGDRLTLELADGRQRAYRVRDAAIVDSAELRIPRDTAAPTLTLVTCYPFDAIVTGGPLRYVVSATLESDDRSASRVETTGM